MKTLLDTIQKRLSAELADMNGIIADALHTSNALMNEIVDHYLLTKGKMIRPIIVLLSAKMFGEVNSSVLHAGASLEMLHNATLIHDDVVDETKMRRGTPTVNSLWDNHVAVLVGDYFVSNSLAVGLKTGNANVVSTLSRLGIELSVGEIDQISNARDHVFRQDAYIDMIRKKTASLFMSCLQIGAETAGAPRQEWQPMLRYAELLGLCFQIKDDIFDYFPQGDIGKPTGNDLREGKVTLPLIYALNNAPAEKALPMRGLLEKEVLTQQEIEELVTFARDNGGIDYSFKVMRGMQAEASAIIAPYPESEAKQSLIDIFEFIISRNK